jgi:hypothetical protein
MSTDYRALCAELIEDVCYLIDCVDHDCCDPVALMECREHVSQTRTALAQSEPEGVTDEEIEREALKNADSDDEYRAFKSGAFFVQERISRPAIEPVSEVLTDEAIEELTWRHTCEIGDLGVGIAVEDAPAFIRAALARWGRPTIEPVPVAERPWEREKGWRDLDGECWWCPPDGPFYWQMANPAMVYGGWLLPPHDLPLPTPTP